MDLEEKIKKGNCCYSSEQEINLLWEIRGLKRKIVIRPLEISNKKACEIVRSLLKFCFQKASLTF